MVFACVLIVFWIAMPNIAVVLDDAFYLLVVYLISYELLYLLEACVDFDRLLMF